MLGIRGFLFSAISLFSALLMGCAAFETGVDPGLQPDPALEEPTLSPELVLNQYIVVLKEDTPSATNVADFFKKKFKFGIPLIFEHALKGFVITLPAGQGLDVLLNNPAVDFVQPDGVVQAFDLSIPLETQDHVASEIPTGVHRFDAEMNPNTASGINVAVMDTGIYKHKDLNVKTGKDCTAWWGKGNTTDQNGHGTHVSGTIGAKDNGTGVVGVAPGVSLYPVKVLNSQGSGTFSGIVCGINWITATRTDRSTTNDIHVVNMSLGGGGFDDGNCGNSNNDAVHKAICNSVAKGVVYVVAAGNSAADAQGTIPASYDEVITVSAIADYNGKGGGGAASTCYNDVDDTFANFSNYGPDVDLAAPGVCIKSTYKSTYATLSGTSMASPHAAGLAALYLKTNGVCSNAGCVSNVRAALVAAGKAQSDVGCGFSGDPDGFSEPLAYANDAAVGGNGAGNCG